MKTKEELNKIKDEVETLNKKLAELTDEELKQVTGGSIGKMESVFEATQDIEDDRKSGKKR